MRQVPTTAIFLLIQTPIFARVKIHESVRTQHLRDLRALRIIDDDLALGPLPGLGRQPTGDTKGNPKVAADCSHPHGPGEHLRHFSLTIVDSLQIHPTELRAYPFAACRATRFTL